MGGSYLGTGAAASVLALVVMALAVWTIGRPWRSGCAVAAPSGDARTDETAEDRPDDAAIRHDARNGFAALRATLTTLDRYDGSLDRGLVRQLRRSAIEEVDRLEHLVLRRHAEPGRRFDVSALVGSVVAGRCAVGTRIVTLLGDEVQGHGRPDDVATALQNLIVNAEVHAPGSVVMVGVVADGHRVAIAVGDRGPGLAPGQAESVFDRGDRGARSPGSGLGLHVARSLMRAQGGDVRVRPRTVGACFVLTLPAAQPVVQQAAQAATGPMAADVSDLERIGLAR